MISLSCVRCFHLLCFLLCVCARDALGVCYRDSQIFQTEYVKCHVSLFLSFTMFAKSLACMQAVNWMTLSSTIFYGWKRHHRNKWCCMRYWIFFTHIFMGIDADVTSIRFELKSIFHEVSSHAIQLQYFYVHTVNPQKSTRKRKQTTKQITTAWEQAHSILVSNQMSQLVQCVMACCVYGEARVYHVLPLSCAMTWGI